MGRHRIGPSAKEIKFVHDIVENGGDGCKAAETAGFSVRSAATIGSRLKVKLADEIDKALRQKFSREAPKMVKILDDLATNAKSEQVKAMACTDWLHRAGFKPKEVVETVQIDQRPAAEQLQDLIALLQGIGYRIEKVDAE